MNTKVSQNIEKNYGNIFGNINGDLHVIAIDNRIPSILANYIPEIANLLLDEDLDTYDTFIDTPLKIERKIDHNKIKSFRFSIIESIKYTLDLDDIIQVVDTNDIWSAKKLQWRVVRLYQEISGKYDKIIENSDEIYRILKNQLKEIYLNSKNKHDAIRDEELEFSLDILICKYFIECKIFIKPPINDCE